MTDRDTEAELRARVQRMEREIERYRELLDNSQDIIYRTDLEGRITFISPSVEQLAGYTVEEAIGMKLAEQVYLHPEERDTLLAQLDEQGRASFEAQLKRKDGSVWWAATNAHLLRDSRGEVIGVEGITRDISERKAAEISLCAMEERFRLAFHTSPDAINLNRLADGIYVDVNEGFTELTRYTREEVIGRSSLEINIWNDPADRQRLVEGLMDTGHVKNLEAEFVLKDGSVQVGLMSARVLDIGDERYILSVTRNIADRKAAEAENARLERQLAQAQKLEAIGRLAGGIAHDLNNQLVPVICNAEMLILDNPPDDPGRESLEQILEAGERARDLVRQLLAFSRKQTLEYRAIDLNEALTNFQGLLRRTIREDIEIELALSERAGPIMADPGQIEQVVMNLVVNASDAMPEGGRIVIATDSEVVSEESADPGVGAAPGDYVALRISDSGSGMDEETRQHIFEPFFSTKGEQGTGLGLATVYGIVKQHGGDVRVRSKPGAGTTFDILLPASAGPPRVVEQERPSSGPTGRETVLVAEDNPQARTVVQAILRQQGYTVLTAGGGREALELLAAHDGQIHLLLTDVIMPDMNGRELHARVAERRPGVKVLYMSGYTDDVIARHGVLEAGLQLIQKPFSMLALTTKVRAVLDE